MPTLLEIIWCFSHDQSELMGYQEKDHNIKCNFHYIISRANTTNMIYDVDVDHLTVPFSFIYSTVILLPPTPPSFPCCTLWREPTMHRPYLRSEKLRFPILFIKKFLGYFCLHIFLPPSTGIFIWIILGLWNNFEIIWFLLKIKHSRNIVYLSI